MTGSAPPRFHHAEDGTSEPDWLLDPRWADLPSVDVAALAARHPRVLVAAAHPDDETLGAGGLVAALARHGASVHVVVATHGEASHPRARGWTPALLAGVRVTEVAAAVEALAPGARLELLGLPDGGLAGLEDRLVEALLARSDRTTLVVAPWSGDGHPDHDALGRAAVTAAARTGATTVQHPVWLWHWGRPDDLPWARAHAVELGAGDVARREVALGAYRSQTEPLGPGPDEAAVVTGAVLRRARRLVEVVLAEPGALPVLPARTEAVVAGPFDAMFTSGDDPWAFEGSFYEQRKRDLTLAVLGRPRYGRVLEIGCATGVLTEALAGRADAVVAVDVSGEALTRARGRNVPGVDWVRGRAPDAVPDGPADLVVLSEVGYFLTPLELLETLRRVRAALAPHGEVVLVHWRHPTEGVPLDGPAVHALARSVLGDLPRRAAAEDADVLVEVWGHPTSVAAAEGRR